MAGRIKAFIVDDSALIRQLLTEILRQTDDIDVAGTAQDPIFARKKIRELQPDVIMLDVEMPRMDGLTFLKELMATNPIPVVMVSALTQRGCETTVRALELGAVDYVTKPGIDVSRSFVELGHEIISKVRVAAGSLVRAGRRLAMPPADRAVPGIPPVFDTSRMTTTDKIIAVGASTGGTQAVTEMLAMLPESTPGILIAQHMPPVFTKSFADRLNILTRLDVREARAGDRVLRGTVLIAPGNKHMVVKRNGAMYYVDVVDGPMVNYVRPSVDVLFRSVVKCAGRNSVGIILTGMGEDGARGLLDMRRSGAFTIAQDEATSVVFGMPQKAIEMGAVSRVAALDDIPGIIMGCLQ